MRFGRVEGHIVERDGELHLTVTLESGKSLEVVREGEVVAFATPDGSSDLDWLADQYTQETIGVDLAELGWEIVAEGADTLENDEARPTGIGRSGRYVVRRPLDPWGGGNV